MAYSYYKFLTNTLSKKSIAYSVLGFKTSGAISSTDWEVFAAFLTGDKAKAGNGCDLIRHEVKSAGIGNSFEYQYHRFSGLEKLEEDKSVDHIFISYGNNYNDVTVRVMASIQVADLFESWRNDIQECYSGNNPRQRCRHSIPFSFVAKEAKTIMTIENGDLCKCDLEKVSISSLVSTS